MLVSEIFLARSPQESHPFVGTLPFGFLVPVQAAKKHSIEAHLGVEPCVGI